MRSRSSLPGWILLLTLCAPAQASVHVQADKVSLPGAQAQQIDVHITPRVGAPPHVRLQIAKVDVAALGWHDVGLTFDGSLERPQPTHWRLDGALKLMSAPGHALREASMRLDVSRGENTMQLLLAGAGATLDIALPLDQLTHMQIDAKRVPLGWLQGLLAQVWAQGKLGAGRVDAKLALDVSANGVRSAGDFRLRGAGFDSVDGTLAAQDLDASGQWRMDGVSDVTNLTLDTTLQGGAVLLGPLFAALPEHASHLHLEADLGAAGVQLSALRFDDGDALRVRGAMAFTSDGEISAVHVDELRAQLPLAYERYATSWLGTLGFTDLTSSGTLGGSLDYRAGQLHSFKVHASHLNVADARGRLAAMDLDGSLDWSADGSRDATTLAWQGLKMWSLPLGPARTTWRSSDGTLRLVAPVAVPLLGGSVYLQELAWSPAASKDAQHLLLSMAVVGVSMPALSRALGWPKFPGTLGGAIPALHYTGQRIDLDGGLSLHVFDGFVDVTHLALQHPFGAEPLLAADISLRQLDLKTLTSTFQFGSMSGRLDGHINDLRLLAWKPVAFDAAVHSDGGRISQDAIASLSQLGGGLAGGLQAAVLRLFHSFGYDRFGLRCRLRDEVCHMGGIEPSNGGYTIVEGSGLPHIEVIGHQHAVDWPTLVARLEAATKGSGPKIE